MSLFQGRTTPPVLTFGRGTLGFMCVYDLNNYREDIGQIIEGRYTVEYKNRFYGLLEGGARTLDFSYNALNEFCISKNTYVLNLDIFINDMFVTQTRGGTLFYLMNNKDGLIVCTPTGSTAYSLSVGGPIVHNDVPCILISPVCPLSLSFRPIVIPDSMKLKIRMSENSKSEGTIIADGQVVTPFRQGDTLTIDKAEGLVPFIHPENEPHFVNWANKLKRLLNWNSKFTNER